MQFSKLISLSALLAGVLAIPTAEVADATLETRAKKVGVYLCNDADFKGYCVHIYQPINDCVQLGSDLNDQVTSVGPDESAGDCRFYYDYGCSDSNGFRHFDLSYPGTPNLYYSQSGANDQISSYQCFGA